MALKCHRLGEAIVADCQPYLGSRIEGWPTPHQSRDPRSRAKAGPHPRSCGPLFHQHRQPSVRPHGLEIGLRGIDRRGPVLGGCEFVREFHSRLRTGPQVEECRSIGLAVETHHVELRRRKILPQRDAAPMTRDPQTETAGGSDGGNQADP